MQTFIVATFLLFSFCSKAQTDTTEKIYTHVEHSPEYPGGDGELLKFVQKNLQWPPEREADEICGTITVRFIIGTNGEVVNPTIIKSCGKGWDAELIRVIKLLPKFKPGIQNGKFVKVYFNLPIHFEHNK